MVLAFSFRNRFLEMLRAKLHKLQENTIEEAEGFPGIRLMMVT